MPGAQVLEVLASTWFASSFQCLPFDVNDDSSKSIRLPARCPVQGADTKAGQAPPVSTQARLEQATLA